MVDATGQDGAFGEQSGLLSISRAAGGLSLAGEADVSTVPALSAALDALAGTAGDVVVDLAELTFIDAASVALLIGLADRLPVGSTLVLSRPRRSVARVLQLLDVESHEGMRIDRDATATS